MTEKYIVTDQTRDPTAYPTEVTALLESATYITTARDQLKRLRSLGFEPRPWVDDKALQVILAVSPFLGKKSFATGHLGEEDVAWVSAITSGNLLDPITAAELQRQGLPEELKDKQHLIPRFNLRGHAIYSIDPPADKVFTMTPLLTPITYPEAADKADVTSIRGCVDALAESITRVGFGDANIITWSAMALAGGLPITSVDLNTTDVMFVIKQIRQSPIYYGLVEALKNLTHMPRLELQIIPGQGIVAFGKRAIIDGTEGRSKTDLLDLQPVTYAGSLAKPGTALMLGVKNAQYFQKIDNVFTFMEFMDGHRRGFSELLLAIESGALGLPAPIIDRFRERSISGLEHLINNAFAYLTGGIDLLISRLVKPDDGVYDGPYDEQLDYMKKALIKARKGVKDLARIGRSKAELKNFNAAEIIEQAVALATAFYSKIHDNDIIVNIIRHYSESDFGAVIVNGTPESIMVAIDNIISNAAKAIRARADGGTSNEIHLYFDSTGSFCTLYAEDTGPGIPRPVLDQYGNRALVINSDLKGEGTGTSACRDLFEFTANGADRPYIFENREVIDENGQTVILGGRQGFAMKRV